MVGWFRALNGAHRIETLCAMLDCCVPFEVRFLGSYVEDLGRRDFHELRDVENKANNFVNHSKTNDENKIALYNLLAAEPGPSTTIPNCNNPNYHGPANNISTSLSHPSILLSSGKKYPC